MLEKRSCEKWRVYDSSHHADGKIAGFFAAGRKQSKRQTPAPNYCNGYARSWHAAGGASIRANVKNPGGLTGRFSELGTKHAGLVPFLQR
jgi:hypothetical protein